MRKLLTFLIALASIVFAVCSPASATMMMTGAGPSCGGSCGGGGGIVFTPGSTISAGNVGFATSFNFTSVNIGTATSDRVVICTISGGGSLDGALLINGVSATLDSSASSSAQRSFYANVPTGTSVTFAYSGNSIGMANLFLSYGMIAGQSGGGSVAPTHHGVATAFQADPIGIAITVDAGGVAFIAASAGAASSGTRTWTGTTSSSGDGYA